MAVFNWVLLQDVVGALLGKSQAKTPEKLAFWVPYKAFWLPTT
jgi:hypothetical protein